MTPEDQQKMQTVHNIIANHLAEIAELTDGRARLTLVARHELGSSHSLLVTDETDFGALKKTIDDLKKLEDSK